MHCRALMPCRVIYSSRSLPSVSRLLSYWLLRLLVLARSAFMRRDYRAAELVDCSDCCCCSRRCIITVRQRGSSGDWPQFVQLRRRTRSACTKLADNSV